MGDSPLEPTAADVLAMAWLVLEREAVLYARAARDKRARLVAQAETGAGAETRDARLARGRDGRNQSVIAKCRATKRNSTCAIAP